MSDTFTYLGAIFGGFGTLWFACFPEGYLEYLPLLGVGAVLVGVGLALEEK